MNNDTAWVERMAQRAREREDARQAERYRADAPWRAFVEARGGWMAQALGDGWGEHSGHYVHGHPAHFNSTMCSCGQVHGVFTTIPPEGPLPDVCTVCRDFHLFDS